MKAEIIAIGTEILLGHIVNTNCAYISRHLAASGIDLFYHTTVGDNPQRLESAIRTALSRSDIVITTGGLGPTLDDITLAGIADSTGLPLVFRPEIARRIKAHFKSRKIRMPQDNLRQAYIPKGATWFRNNIGTAPGFSVKTGDRYLIALPGPPYELQPIFDRYVISLIKKISPKRGVIFTRTLKITGLAESQVHHKVKDMLRLSGDTTVGIYAYPSQTELKMTSKARDIQKAKKNIAPVEKAIRRRLKEFIFGADDETLEAKVAAMLRKRSIAIAESCTGGLLSSRLTDVPGISKNLIMSIVCYSNRAKMQLLNVRPGLISKYGAVSAPVAKSLAENIRNISDADIGIGISGIAGPGGATKTKPVGLVYIAMSTATKAICKEYRFIGDRRSIKFRASQAALDMLRRYLAKI